AGVDAQRHAALRRRRPLGAHVAQRLVPDRALGDERRQFHDGLRVRWGGRERARKLQERGQQHARHPAGRAGFADHRFSSEEVVSGAVASSRKKSDSRSSNDFALRWSTIVASRFGGSLSGSNWSARSRSRRISARSCCITETLWASVTYGE